MTFFNYLGYANNIHNNGFLGPGRSSILWPPDGLTSFSVAFVTLFYPEFNLPTFGKKINVGLIVGTVGGGLFFVILVIVILWTKGYTIGEKVEETELRGTDLQNGKFTLKQMKAATKNFHPSNKLGEGGFGSVYKGVLSDATKIAVKQLSAKSKQGAKEFLNEISMISALRHPNLVRLYGCCVEADQMLLIYEYMENNCLSRALFGTGNVSKAKLTWPVRVNICIGIARGLLYLHEESNLKIIHRDIKASNILLDKNFNAKISDFGLARLNDDENTHVVTRVAGTVGYMAPEYAMRGYLTLKADVYSFGVVILEIVSGKSNNYHRFSGEDSYFLYDWAIHLQRNGNLLELVDPDLGSQYSSEEASTMLNVALLCQKASHNARPTISETINMLEGRSKIQDFQNTKASSTPYLANNSSRNHRWQDHSEIRPRIDESYTDPCVTESIVPQLPRAPMNDEPYTESCVTESIIPQLPRAPMSDEPYTEPCVTKSIVSQLPRAPMNDEPYTESFVTDSVITELS